MNKLTIQQATIANGASLSAAIELGVVGAALVGIEMPAAWTAANLTFQASVDGTNFNNLYDKDGNEVTVTASTSRYIGLIPSLFAGFRAMKIRSGTSGAAVNQGGDRILKIVTREV